MNSYGNSLIAVMVICQISSALTPNSEYSKRYIKIVCALVTLITLLAPIKHLSEFYDDISDKISSFFSTDVTEKYDENEVGAIGIMQYISEKYDIADISMVIQTDESDTEIVAINVFVSNCPYSKRALIEADLNEQLELPTKVLCE